VPSQKSAISFCNAECMKKHLYSLSEDKKLNTKLSKTNLLEKLGYRTDMR